MTSRLIACLLLAGAVAACDAGTAGPPTPISDALGGTEMTDKTGYEPPGGSEVTPDHGSTIQQLCAYDCMRFEAICPGSSGGTACTSSCIQSLTNLRGCEAQFQSYLACLAQAPLTCMNGSLDTSACNTADRVLLDCAGFSGGSSSGGTGSAGTSGTADAPLGD